MLKSDSMKKDLENLKNECQKFLDDKKIDEAKKKIEEINNLKSAIEIQQQLEADEMEQLKAKNIQNESQQTKKISNKEKENANIIRAMLKKVTGKPLTEAENALLLPTTSNTDGENGESYILPQDIRTIITKKLREYKSLRDVLGYMPVTALSGSFPIENFETVTELVDFVDGQDGKDTSEIKFKSVKFSLTEKAAFIKLSNTLLSLTDNALISYISDIFSKKAVKTENRIAISKLKENKTIKDIADWKALRTSLNVDLDPAALFGTVIVTNQDGFDVLDSALDNFGRPILQVNPTEPTKRLFSGYPIIVYSNVMLPTEEGKAPIIYGNLKEAVKFVDLNGRIAFKTSSEAGFLSNTTIARLIEFIDIVQCDSSDKCYVYGQLPITSNKSVSNKA